MTRRFSNQTSTAINGIQKTLKDLGAKRFEIKQSYEGGKDEAMIRVTKARDEMLARIS